MGTALKGVAGWMQGVVGRWSKATRRGRVRRLFHHKLAHYIGAFDRRNGLSAGNSSNCTILKFWSRDMLRELTRLGKRTHQDLLSGKISSCSGNEPAFLPEKTAGPKTCYCYFPPIRSLLLKSTKLKKKKMKKVNCRLLPAGFEPATFALLQSTLGKLPVPPISTTR